LIRGRGIGYVREASPLFDSPSKERGEVEGLKGLRPFKFPLVRVLFAL